MANFNFLKTEQDFVASIQIVEEYKGYTFDLMNADQILPTTYLQVAAAANAVIGRIFNRLTNLYIDDILVSDESLEAIVNSATSENNREDCVKPVIEQYVDMVMDFVEEVFKRETREFVDEDAEVIVQKINALEKIKR